jgi:hypothetical protein
MAGKNAFVIPKDFAMYRPLRCRRPSRIFHLNSQFYRLLWNFFVSIPLYHSVDTDFEPEG